MTGEKMFGVEGGESPEEDDTLSVPLAFMWKGTRAGRVARKYEQKKNTLSG